MAVGGRFYVKSTAVCMPERGIASSLRQSTRSIEAEHFCSLGRASGVVVGASVGTRAGRRGSKLLVFDGAGCLALASAAASTHRRRTSICAAPIHNPGFAPLILPPSLSCYAVVL